MSRYGNFRHTGKYILVMHMWECENCAIDSISRTQAILSVEICSNTLVDRQLLVCQCLFLYVMGSTLIADLFPPLFVCMHYFGLSRGTLI